MGRRVRARQKKLNELAKPSTNELLIQKLGKLFYGKSVNIPKHIIGTRSLISRGLTRKKNGKLVLTDAGNKKLLGRTLARLEHKKSNYAGQKWGYEPLNYTDIFFNLKKLLGKFKGKRILDLGFREPVHLKELKTRGADSSGLDLHPFEKVKGLNLVQGDVEKLDKYFKGKKFDAIISSSLFDPGSGFSLSEEKVKDMRNKRVLSLLDKVNEKLTEGGYLMIQTLDPLFIEKWQFKKSGFNIVMKKKLRNRCYLTIVRK